MLPGFTKWFQQGKSAAVPESRDPHLGLSCAVLHVVLSVWWSVMLVLILKRMSNNMENANNRGRDKDDRDQYIELGTFGSATLW